MSPPLNIDELKFYAVIAIQVLNAGASAAVWLYVRYGDRNAQIDKRFADLSEDIDRRMDEQDRDIHRLRGLAERAPTHADLAQVYEKINQTAHSVATMAGEMRGMNDTLRLILSRVAQRGMP